MGENGSSAPLPKKWWGSRCAYNHAVLSTFWVKMFWVKRWYRTPHEKRWYRIPHEKRWYRTPLLKFFGIWVRFPPWAKMKMNVLREWKCWWVSEGGKVTTFWVRGGNMGVRYQRFEGVKSEGEYGINVLREWVSEGGKCARVSEWKNILGGGVRYQRFEGGKVSINVLSAWVRGGKCARGVRYQRFSWGENVREWVSEKIF